jgi:hypothetical protein
VESHEARHGNSPPYLLVPLSLAHTGGAGQWQRRSIAAGSPGAFMLYRKKRANRDFQPFWITGSPRDSTAAVGVGGRTQAMRR